MPSKKKKDPKFYLEHILQAADDVAEFIAGYDKKEFAADKKTNGAVIHQSDYRRQRRRLDEWGSLKGNLPYSSLVC